MEQQVSNLEIATIKKYLIEEGSYILTIARLEPENNIELMCDAYLDSTTNCHII